MIEVSLKPDKLTSLLVCYHILCAPTDMNKKYNPAVFEALKNRITPQERGFYLSFLIDKLGVKLNQMDNFRTSLFFPKCSSLDEFLETNEAKNSPKEVRTALKRFEKHFNPYWEKVENEINALKGSRLKLAKKHITRIYELQEQMTGETNIPRPKEIDIKIVEGLSPSSFGRGNNNSKHCIVEQKRMYESERTFLATLIHETNPHSIAQLYVGFHNQFFGRWIYEIEEGFVKLLTSKIYEKLTGNESHYGPGSGLETSYSVFEKNWPRLKSNNFAEWYKGCLIEIKDKFDL